jgi:hypothetical protein
MHINSGRYLVKMGSEHNFSFNSSKARWHSRVQIKGFSGLSISVNGRAILEKLAINVRKYENNPIKDCSSLKLVGGVSLPKAADFFLLTRTPPLKIVCPR